MRLLSTEAARVTDISVLVVPRTCSHWEHLFVTHPKLGNPLSNPLDFTLGVTLGITLFSSAWLHVDVGYLSDLPL